MTITFFMMLSVQTHIMLSGTYRDRGLYDREALTIETLNHNIGGRPGHSIEDWTEVLTLARGLDITLCMNSVLPIKLYATNIKPHTNPTSLTFPHLCILPSTF
nr:hypothetical protein Q903MT_gene5116 [Picea sitchensis]